MTTSQRVRDDDSATTLKWVTVSSNELNTARAAGSTTAKLTSSPENSLIASIDLHRVSTWM